MGTISDINLDFCRENFHKCLQDNDREMFDMIYKDWINRNTFVDNEERVKIRIGNYLFSQDLGDDDFLCVLEDDRTKRYKYHEWFEDLKLLHHTFKFKNSHSKVSHCIIVKKPTNWSWEFTELTPEEEMLRIKNLDEAQLRKEERQRKKKIEFNKNRRKN